MEYRDTKMQLAFFIIKLDFTLEIWNSTNYFEIDLWAFKTTHWTFLSREIHVILCSKNVKHRRNLFDTEYNFVYKIH